MFEKITGCTGLLIALIPFAVMVATDIEQALWMFPFCIAGMLICAAGIAFTGDAKRGPVTALLGFSVSAISLGVLFLIMGGAY